MVRLKGFVAVLRSNPSVQFQFQNGAIKRKIEQEITRFEISFNSKMVRLKEHLWHLFQFHLSLFQFQNGAIKRL